MANPQWPIELPQLLIYDGHEEQPPDVVLRTQMDAGPDKVRRRFTAGIRPVAGKMILNLAQVQTLDDFFDFDLKGGSLPFDWQTQRGFGLISQVTNFADLTDVSLLLSAAAYRFARGARPRYRHAGGGGDFWEAALELELMP